ncbi:MAG: acyl-protein synthetase [Ruminiclostridium sp.]|nr:acyl-protein synthetase [Ruminiclostridium sp.]
MDYRKKLFSVKNPYDTEGTKELFLKAVKENCAFHYKNCLEYRKILDSRDFSPDDLRSYEDIARLPFLPTVFLKSHRIFSMPESKMLIKATSSGTSGKYSKVGFDLGSLTSGLKMLIRVAKPRKLISPRPANYIIFGYKPHKGNETAIAKTATGYTFFTPALSRTYALKFGRNGYEHDLEGVIKAIVKHSKSKSPLRFIGFPAYTYFTLKMMDERGIHVKLPRHSMIMLGGGWKQFYKEQVDKQSMYDLVYKVLGIGEESVVESFGAAEHPILYCDCEKHHFHIPVYSRVIIRDVNTLEPVPDGQVGLVNLITPMVRATPVLSVMTDDLGVIHSEDCGCGNKSPYLEIIGRVGLKDIKTCAAGAAELISEAKK